MRPAAAAPPRRPEPVEQHRAGRNHPSPRQILRHPRAKGSREPARNAGEKARRRPLSCFGATPLVAKLPRRSAPTDAHSTPRARVWPRKMSNAGAPEAVLARPLSWPSYPVAPRWPMPLQRLARARALARQWSARCYGVARQREGSRQNNIGVPALTMFLDHTRAGALMARQWSARCYGVARQREGSRQNSIGGLPVATG